MDERENTENTTPKDDNFDRNAGYRIRRLRERAGYSREQLSEMANISAKFLYEIEAGHKGMSARTACELALALNVTTDYILMDRGISTSDEVTLLERLLSGLSPSQYKHIYLMLVQARELALSDSNKKF